MEVVVWSDLAHRDPRHGGASSRCSVQSCLHGSGCDGTPLRLSGSQGLPMGWLVQGTACRRRRLPSSVTQGVGRTVTANVGLVVASW